MSVTRSYGGVSAGDRRAERRDRLIDAAIALYGAHGYRNAGVRAVCQAAGLTERYFYENFANSEALLAASFDRLVSGLIDRIRGAADPAMPVPVRAQAMLAAYYGAIRDHPEAARVFLVEITGVSPTIDAAFERSLERLTELILDTHDPRRRGAVAGEPLLRRGVAGGLLHIALAWIGEGFERPLDAVVAAALPLCRLAEPAACEI